MWVRRLLPADADAFSALRLYALRESPSAFAASHHEEAGQPIEVIKSRLSANAGSAVFGALDSGELIGMVGLRRETPHKLSHKAFVWGLYVSPKSRGMGLGRLLLAEAVAHAQLMAGVQQLNLSVNAGNAGAIALYESLGFKVYGCEKRALMVLGVPYDELHMSLRFAGN